MSVATESVAITEPGVYGMPDHVYLADPVPSGSLSSSGARKLLPPSCPAIFKWERDHPPASTSHFDFGHAAHALVLGAGAEIVSVDATDWRTKAAKEAREAAYAQGRVPLLAADVAQVEAMAQAILQHPIASLLLDPTQGSPEQSIFWQDERHEVWRRARLDWLPDAKDGRMIVPDFKTTVSAEPLSFAKSFANYGYFCQAAWYQDAVRAVGLADDVAFVFIAQEKTAPYLVTVFEPDAESLRIGRRLNDRALEVYSECAATDAWPSYSTDVELLSLPAWFANRHQEI